MIEMMSYQLYVTKNSETKYWLILFKTRFVDMTKDNIQNDFVVNIGMLFRIVNDLEIKVKKEQL